MDKEIKCCQNSFYWSENNFSRNNALKWNWSSSLLFFTFMRLPLLSRLPRLHLVCWVLSVSWLKWNPAFKHPKKISTQTRGETNFTFLSPAHSDQDLKSVQTGIFLNFKKTWVRTLPFQPTQVSFPSYSFVLKHCVDQYLWSPLMIVWPKGQAWNSLYG